MLSNVTKLGFKRLNSRFRRMAKHMPVFGLTAARLQIQVPIRPSPGEVSGTRCAIFRRDAVVVQCLRRRLEVVSTVEAPRARAASVDEEFCRRVLFRSSDSSGACPGVYL